MQKSFFSSQKVEVGPIPYSNRGFGGSLARESPSNLRSFRDGALGCLLYRLELKRSSGSRPCTAVRRRELGSAAGGTYVFLRSRAASPELRSERKKCCGVRVLLHSSSQLQ